MRMVLAILGFSLANAAFAAPPALEQVKALEEQMQKVIDDATPNVVAIVVSHQQYGGGNPKKPWQLGSYTAPMPSTLTPQIDPRDLREPKNAANNQFGSGIVLDAAKGLILTTNHLIDKATKIYIRCSNGEGSYANIHASDTRSDLAVLKLIDPPAGMTTAKLGTVILANSTDGKKPNLKRGSWIVAVGHSLGTGFADGQPSASWGIVANIRRKAGVRTGGDDTGTSVKPLHYHGSLIQTDARVTLGSSGSALLNMDGEVVGIASSVAAVSGSEASGGYAIPMASNYRRIISSLMEGREVDYGFLGITSMNDLTNRGVIIVSGVTPGGPAQLAGIQRDDQIIEVDGSPIKEYEDLLHYIGSALAGTEIPVTVTRGGRNVTLKCTLAKTSDQMPFIASVPPATVHGLQVDYWSVKIRRDGVWVPGATVPPGVAVRSLEPGSAAEKRFKDAGADALEWIITHVDNKAVANPAEFHRAAASIASVKLTLTDPKDRTKTTTITLP